MSNLSWPMLFVALQGPFALCILVASHLFIAIRCSAKSPWGTIFKAFLVAVCCTVAFTVIGVSLSKKSLWDMIALVAVNAWATAALAFGYFNFVNLGFTSLRVRLLRELLQNGGELTLSEISRRYASNEIRDIRLARLLENGTLRRHQGRYRLANANRFLLIARVLDWTRRFTFGDRSPR